jgi:chitin disaccharide deacetylase
MMPMANGRGPPVGTGVPASVSSEMTALLDRLGLPAQTRAVVLSARGLGLSHAANTGVLAAVRLGLATSASLLVPCPWSRDAAARARDVDVGLELVLNAPFETYRWSALTHAPSLGDGDGGLPRTIEDTWEHADLDEARRECRTQLERAQMWGVDITHLASYLHVLSLRPEFFDVLLDLASEFALPVQLPPQSAERRIGFPLRELAADEGILHVDRMLEARGRAGLLAALRGLEPGVTEVSVWPAEDTPELRAYSPSWSVQVEEQAAVRDDAEVAALLRNTTLLGYADLRRAQRN